MTGQYEGQQWVEFGNSTGGTIPANAIMFPTGLTVIETGRVVLTVEQGVGYGDAGSCVINDCVPVPNGGYGVCTRSALVIALYDNRHTPSAGAMWGPGQLWSMQRDYPGWLAIGVVNASAQLAMFMPTYAKTSRGKPRADVAPGADGTVDIWVGPVGGEYQPDDNPFVGPVHNYSTCTVKGGALATFDISYDSDFSNPEGQFIVAATA